MASLRQCRKPFAFFSNWVSLSCLAAAERRPQLLLCFNRLDSCSSSSAFLRPVPTAAPPAVNHPSSAAWLMGGRKSVLLRLWRKSGLLST